MDRQLPGFEVAEYAPRRHRHALVIPVINEGERIRGQLQRVQAAQLPVDVIVADGGSTDGSLEPAFVRSAGVRAVLTKTGPGKLSAQLRMAYAWCLDQGYDGVVTIDGNGKDGVEAVAEFVAQLEAGYDYVQGSRHAKGGVAENTPLEREVGNRLVHAPMLSLAGLHWFTDTTNGFRAYSRRYLEDPGVAPFRDVFQRYELLFYLTTRAGQLGYRVTEIPVVRRYPAGEPPPTKIAGWKGKLAILKETFDAALGRFAPKTPAGELAPTLAEMVLSLMLGALLGWAAAPAAAAAGDVVLQVLAAAIAACAFLVIGRRIAGEGAAGLPVRALAYAALALGPGLSGDPSLLDGRPPPAAFAAPLAAWGIAAAAGDRWLASYLLFAGAALLQPAMGAVPGLMLLPALLAGLYRRAEAWKLVGAAAWIGVLAWAGLSGKGPAPWPLIWAPGPVGWLDAAALLVAGLCLTFGPFRRSGLRAAAPLLAAALLLGALGLVVSGASLVWTVEVAAFFRIAVVTAVAGAAFGLWNDGRRLFAPALLLAALAPFSGFVLLGLTVLLRLAPKR